MSSPTCAAAASTEFAATTTALSGPTCPHASAPAMATATATTTTAGAAAVAPAPLQDVGQRASGADAAHAVQLAREQQQMIEQLMSSGLVQPADLLEFGFSAEELRAVGLQLSAPPPAAPSPRAVATPVEDEARPYRRGRPQKRAWGDEEIDTDAVPAQAHVTPPPASATATGEPATVAKALHVTSATSSGPAPQQPWRSEQSRAADLHAAQLVGSMRHRVAGGVTHPCARHLCYGDAQDEEEPPKTTATAMSAMAGHGPARSGNTALAFSGLDVAVVKEIAQRLQAECGRDADVESQRMREYYESREDGNTPYM